jgi:DNA modification methylase
MADNSVDAIVTDPPYGLNSGRERLEDIFFPTLFNVFFPKFHQLVAKISDDLQFLLPFDRVMLLNRMNRAFWIEPPVGVEEGTVDLDYDVVDWNEEVEHTRKASVCGSNRVLRDERDTHRLQNRNNFFLKLRPCVNSALSDSAACGFTELGFGRIGMAVVIPFDSCFAGFLRTLNPSLSSGLADVVRLLNDSEAFAQSPASVVTSAGTELRVILTVDTRNGTCEIAPAGRTCKFDAVFEFVCPKYVGTLTRAGGLAAMFESYTVGFVGDTANRACTLNLHRFIVPYIQNQSGGFMGRRWDSDVPSMEIWQECLRVLKPGGYLLAFAGTRTQHRMACRIEDAGFEIRDMIAWVYGSGFPKSLNIGKAVDELRGTPRESLGRVAGMGKQNPEWNGTAQGRTENSFKPEYEASRGYSEWEGWGTALKPAVETVTFASKPYTEQQECDIILSNLIQLEVRLWLLSLASVAERNSTSSPSEYVAACAIAQWDADEITNTRAALFGQMDTSQLELAIATSLNIVSSWKHILAESWNNGNTSTTETKLNTTIDWKTLKFSLSQITPASIIKACNLPGGFGANASTAESHFNASLSLLQNILTLSATEPVMSLEQREYQDEGVKPNLDPCIMARKPLSENTVATNCLKWGTGGINIDGCRVPFIDDADRSESVEKNQHADFNSNGGVRYNTQGIYGGDTRPPANYDASKGRFPANLIHDGSPDVLAHFPLSSTTGRRKEARTSSAVANTPFTRGVAAPEYVDSGSASRFFYCAKAAPAERNAGVEGGNRHPTVKPVALMEYLVKLVSREGATVLDPFAGSGTTGVACARLGRFFVGIERETESFDTMRQRVERSLA